MSDEKSVDHWAGDRLERKQDAEFLYNFLVGETAKRKEQGRVASYVLNLDADWGGGKTFFLERLAEDIKNRGHLVARINAWHDDHAQDPYIAIMSAIDKAFAPYVKKPGKIATAWSATKTSGGPIALKIGGAVLKGLLKKHTGTTLEELIDLIPVEDEEQLSDLAETAIKVGAKEAGAQLDRLFDSTLEALIDGFKRTEQATVDFRKRLETAVASLGSQKKAPLFILVDELDRCRPTYAVQLLERVKHLFDVDGVVFVFGTNADQLQHSIAGAYGPNFDGFRYLKRFFDRTYVFDEPSISAYVQSLCERLPQHKLRAPEDSLVQAIALGCKAYNFDLRAIGYILEMIDAASTAWTHSLPIDIVLLFPVCAHFYQTGKAEWPSHQSPELKKWVLSRHQPDRFTRKNVDISIRYGEGYRAAIAMFKSMAQISQFNPTTHDIAIDHVRQTFDPEWNGVPTAGSAPSIQTELLGLVANAGRLAEPKMEKEYVD